MTASRANRARTGPVARPDGGAEPSAELRRAVLDNVREEIRAEVAYAFDLACAWDWQPGDIRDGVPVTTASETPCLTDDCLDRLWCLQRSLCKRTSESACVGCGQHRPPTITAGWEVDQDTGCWKCPACVAGQGAEAEGRE